MVIDLIQQKVRRKMRKWAAEGMREGFIASGMTPEEADARIAEAEEMFIAAEIQDIQDRLSELSGS